MDLEILKIASNTENHKVLKNHTHSAKNKNPICGDEMQISLIMISKTFQQVMREPLCHLRKISG